MSFDAPTLLRLLPAVYASRDGAQALTSPGLLAAAEKAELATLAERETSGPALSALETDRLAALRQQALAGPLASLLAVIAEQFAVLEEDLEQLLDDPFIETCAEYLVPYIGDLIGVRTLHDVGANIGRARAEVAHTLGYRRRKGTVPVLEGIAFDVSGWPAAAAEFFQRLITTQYMNHRRLHIHAAPELRRWESLQHIGSAFDSIPRSVDVRRIASRRGRHNIPNVGLFLWRLDAQSLTGSPALPVDLRRWRFHPLGIDAPLFSKPLKRPDDQTLNARLNVPQPITRRELHERPSDWCDATTQSRSFAVEIDRGSGYQAVQVLPPPPVPAPDPGVPLFLVAAHLGENASAATRWGSAAEPGRVCVDSELGRIELPPEAQANWRVRCRFHTGFSADLGGGEYERAIDGNDAAAGVPTLLVPTPQHPTIQAALTALSGRGVVEIGDSGRYEENLVINVAADETMEIRAVNGHRPTVVLGQVMTLRGAAGSGVRLDGLLICGDGLRVPKANNALARLELAHCTLVPGLELAPDLTPQFPKDASLVAELPDLQLSARRCIFGALRVEPQARAAFTDCILDATAPDEVVYAGLNGKTEGAHLSLSECTLVGRVHARKLDASNCIFLTVAAKSGDWDAPVKVQRRQEGCVRFCWIPPESRTPSRFQCLPESAASPADATPRFTSLRFGHPGYAQLAVSSGVRLLTGADDESEPGAFHHLHGAQRETNLRVRLDEYLRAGLEAGIFYEN